MPTNVVKIIKCRAAIFTNVGEPLKVVEITVDPPKTYEIRVRMISTSICATELHVVNGTDFGFEFIPPMILGHEGAGIVESVGEGVKGVNVGDHVIPLAIPNCEKCKLCKCPATNFCEEDIVEMSKELHLGTKLNGQPIKRVFGMGTFAEYILLKQSQVAVVNRKANLKDIALIGCALITGYGAAQNLAKVYKGSKCVIWGLGGVGLSTVIGCKLLGAKTIIGIDINNNKEEISKRLGCTEFINPRTFGKSLEEYLKNNNNNNDGIDFAFDCVGSVAIVEMAMRCLNVWGKMIIVGALPFDGTFSAPIGQMLRGQQIVGGYQGNLKTRKAIQSLVDKCVKGDIRISGLITQRIKLEDINAGLELVGRGEAIRCVVEF